MTERVDRFIKDELEHFGKKGMHWGQRKAAKQEKHAAFNASVDAARAKSKYDYHSLRAANKRFSKEKKTIGRKQAKLNLNDTRQRIAANAQLANKAKFGHERTKEIVKVSLISAGVLALAASSAYPALENAAANKAVRDHYKAGAKATQSILKEVGSHPTVSLRNINGVFQYIPN